MSDAMNRMFHIDAPNYVLRTAGSVELPIDSGALSESLLEAAMPGIRSIIEAAAAVYDTYISALKFAVNTITEVWRRLLDAIGRDCVPAKWWHIYTHTKKARIRKKYRDRITRAVLAAMALSDDGGGDA